MKMIFSFTLVSICFLATGQQPDVKNVCIKVYLNEGIYARKDHFKISGDMNLSRKNEIFAQRKADSVRYESIIADYKGQKTATADGLNNELKKRFTYLDQNFFTKILSRLNEELSKSHSRP